jgi:hypothetical protein
MEIAPSPIHGFGLFATKNIKKNQKLCDYTGTGKGRVRSIQLITTELIVLIS